MRRLILSLSVAALASGLVTPATASAQQAVNLWLGGFNVRSADARGTDDVLFRNGDFLAFNLSDFNGFTTGGDYLVGLGPFLEGGLGIGYYSRTVPSVYRDYVNADGSEIQQDLHLRIVPFTATVRLLPLGNHGFKPYIGAGVGVFSWRYSETGQFVDFTDYSIFRDSFVGSGTAVGPVILGGVTIPMGPFGIGGEIRYQAAKGDLPASENFAGSRIDLGGTNYLFVFNVRF
jgi:opacity protein-like surface antigen